jgi:hypothetical protein
MYDESKEEWSFDEEDYPLTVEEDQSEDKDFELALHDSFRTEMEEEGRLAKPGAIRQIYLGIVRVEL